MPTDKANSITLIDAGQGSKLPAAPRQPPASRRTEAAGDVGGHLLGMDFGVRHIVEVLVVLWFGHGKEKASAIGQINHSENACGSCGTSAGSAVNPRSNTTNEPRRLRCVRGDPGRYAVGIVCMHHGQVTGEKSAQKANR